MREAKDVDAVYLREIQRGLYYCCRMISAQKNTRFTKSDYGKICKVYSIWIIINPNVSEQNSITEYTIEESKITGSFCTEKENYDLMSMVVLSLGDAKSTESEILRLLDTMFVSKLSSAELRDQLKEDFDLTLSPKMEKEVTEMCNLSIGIEERGIEIGRAEGRAEGARSTNRRLRDMKKLSLEERAVLLDYPQETVKKWDEEDLLVLA